MATYYIGADVHSNNTELAIEQRGRIVARYSVPTTIGISTRFGLAAECMAYEFPGRSFETDE